MNISSKKILSVFFVIFVVLILCSGATSAIVQNKNSDKEKDLNPENETEKESLEKNAFEHSGMKLSKVHIQATGRCSVFWGLFAASRSIDRSNTMKFRLRLSNVVNTDGRIIIDGVEHGGGHNEHYHVKALFFVGKMDVRIVNANMHAEVDIDGTGWFVEHGSI